MKSITPNIQGQREESLNGGLASQPAPRSKTLCRVSPALGPPAGIAIVKFSKWNHSHTCSIETTDSFVGRKGNKKFRKTMDFKQFFVHLLQARLSDNTNKVCTRKMSIGFAIHINNGYCMFGDKSIRSF